MMKEAVEDISYFDEAGLNASLIFQKDLFQDQTDFFLNNILKKTFISNSAQENKFQEIPPLLINPTRSINPNKLLDTEEVIIVSVLDSDGILSICTRLVEFMIMMTRITKADHRSLCIHILLKASSENCLKSFASFGGLRILKRWIKLAEEEESVYELYSLILLCKKLALDEKNLKEAIDLGRVVKKLLKLKLNSSYLDSLHEEIRSLMEEWALRIQKMSVVIPKQVNQQTKSLNDDLESSKLAIELSGRLVKMKGEEVKQKVSIEIKEEREVTLINTDDKYLNVSNFASVDNKYVDTSGHSESKASFEDNELITSSKTLFSVNKLENSDRIVSTNNLNTFLSQPTSSSLSTSLLLNPTAIPIKTPSAVPTRERRVTDMAEGARKLLAMKALSKQNKENGNEIETNMLSNEEVKEDAISSKSTFQLVSILKKSNGENKKKRGVQWADQSGGTLREVHTIEVEKIKNSVADYKNHRDLVKKEKQIEKETHLSKVHEAMQKQTDWRTPVPVQFSIEVLTNRENPVESAEKEIQDKRLGLVLEVRYLDDSLIPMDPDDSSNTPDIHSDFKESDVKVVPWFVPGTETETNVTTQITPFDNNMSVMSAASMSALPLSLQSLNPQILQMIQHDVNLQQSLLNSDGTIDENRLNILTTTLFSNPNLLPFNQQKLQQQQPIQDYNYNYSNDNSFNNQYQSQQPYHSVNQINMNNMSLGLLPNNNNNNNNNNNYNMNNIDTNSVSRNTRWSDMSSLGDNNNIQKNINYNQNNFSSLDSSSSSFLSNQIAPDPWRYPANNNNSNNNSNNLDQPKKYIKPTNRFPTSKSEAPCRFFNTAKGCGLGDKCGFGHFQDMNASPNNNSNNNNRRNTSGPGSRHQNSSKGPGSKGNKRR